MKAVTKEKLDPATLLESLETEEKKAIFTIETGLLRSLVNHLVEKGFFWFLPVILTKSTDPLWPDAGASIEKRVELEIYDEKVRTMQSMIIHKRILASTGMDKFFILSPNIRIEKRERAYSGSHLYEFTQLDIEAAYWKMEDIFKLFEETLHDAIRYVNEGFKDELKTLRREITVPEAPFKVYRRGELEKEYGKEWETVVPEKLKNPIWVTDIPREFYDFEDEVDGSWRNFDLFLPDGYGEVISGAEREYEFEKIIRKIRRDGLKTDDFKILLKYAQEGKLKPSCGAGIGVERFVSYICGVEHVAEVQPFPRIPGIVPEL